MKKEKGVLNWMFIDMYQKLVLNNLLNVLCHFLETTSKYGGNAIEHGSKAIKYAKDVYNVNKFST